MPSVYAQVGHGPSVAESMMAPEAKVVAANHVKAIQEQETNGGTNEPTDGS